MTSLPWHHFRIVWVTMILMTVTIGVSIAEAKMSTSTLGDGDSVEPLSGLKLNRRLDEPSFANEGWPQKEGVPVACLIPEAPYETTLNAQILNIDAPDALDPGESFAVTITVQNDGNHIWYNEKSGCLERTILTLNTEYTPDRSSIFYSEQPDSGWISPRQIELQEMYILPGETGHFTFKSTAPNTNNYYVEYFSLVANNKTRLDNTVVPLHLKIGEITEEDEEKAKFIKTISIDTRSLSDDRSIEVNLDDQTMMLKFGDVAVQTTPMSSGAYKTPTPPGNYKILNKAELLVGSKPPYYRMPYYMGFTYEGHGFHALPYIGDPNGVFWQEALTHIGTKVSHGCIRQLPDDAVLAYEFTYIGMPVWIHH